MPTMNPKLRTAKLESSAQQISVSFPTKRVVFLDVVVRRFARSPRQFEKLDRPNSS
jgi:hypothetical protein